MNLIGFTCAVFFTVTTCQARGIDEWSSGEQVELIVAVDHHVKSSGVFITDFNNFNTNIPEIQKCLAKKGIPTWTIRIASNTTEIFNDYKETQHKPLGIIFSGVQNFREKLFKMFKTTKVKDTMWLVFLENDTIEDTFHRFYIPMDSLLLVVRKHGPVVYVWEVYNVFDASPLQVFLYGSWTVRNGLKTNSILRKERYNLQGITLRAVVQDVKQVTMLVEDGNETRVVGGCFGDVWHLLEKHLNFTTKYIRADGNSVGSLKKDGTWTGMMGIIVRGEADVGLTRAYITSRREAAADFSLPLLTIRQSVFIKSSDSNMLGWDNYLRPFTYSLWLAILLSVLMISFLFFIMYCQASVDHNIHTHSSMFTLTTSLFAIFGAFCMQSCILYPTTTSCRLVLVSSFAVSTVITAAYSASIISNLARLQPNFPFTTFKGLMDHSLYRLGAVKDSGHIDIFNNPENEELHKIYHRVMAPISDLPLSVPDALKRVCIDKYFTVIVDSDMATSHLKESGCRITTLPDAHLAASLSILLQLDSPYKNSIDFMLMKIHNTGILKKLYYQYYPNNVEEEANKLSRVSFSVVAPLLALLGTAIILSLAILFAENFVFHILKKRETVHKSKNQKYFSNTMFEN